MFVIVIVWAGFKSLPTGFTSVDKVNLVLTDYGLTKFRGVFPLNARTTFSTAISAIFSLVS